MPSPTHLASITLLSLALGCGPPALHVVPVSGTVTLEGQPVEGAAVLFSPQAGGRPAVGTTDAQGRFDLTTMKTGDGALEGLHSVTVTKLETTGVEADAEGLAAPTSGPVRVIWLVPQRYSRAETSELSAEVKADMPPVELKLSK